MDERERAIQWLREHNQFGENTDFARDMVAKLDEAISKQDKIITTWVIGKGLLNKESAFKLRWDQGNFSAVELSEEEAIREEAKDLNIVSYAKDVPGSAPETATQEGSSQPWRERLNDIYLSMSVEITDTGNRVPGSRKEVINGRAMVADLRREFPDDKELAKELDIWDSVFDYASKRKFNGSKVTIAAVVIATGFCFYMGNKANISKSDLLIDEAEKKQKHYITQIERNIKTNKDAISQYTQYETAKKKEIEEIKGMEQTTQIKERLGVRQKELKDAQAKLAGKKKTLESNQEKLKKISAMSPEEYRDYRVKGSKKSAGKMTGYGWRNLLWLIPYILCCFVPIYTLNKRATKQKQNKGSWFLRMVGRVMDSGQTVVYRYSDGSTRKDESGHLDAFAFGIALLGVGIILTVVFLPWIVAIQFVRNVALPYLT